MSGRSFSEAIVGDSAGQRLNPIKLPERTAISHREHAQLFASSEVGAQRVGIIQSMLVTCRLHEVDAYTYLVDVLQRISVRPATQEWQ